jgi:hypothetical protein
MSGLPLWNLLQQAVLPHDLQTTPVVMVSCLLHAAGSSCLVNTALLTGNLTSLPLLLLVVAQVPHDLC